MIVVIDSGGANLNSIIFALQRLGVEAHLTIDRELIRKASHVILPGVGTASEAMQRLHNHYLIEVICELTQPVLGICLGMQLLYEHSAEGDVECLGILKGRVEALIPQPNLSIPHMGWNTFEVVKDNELGCFTSAKAEFRNDASLRQIHPPRVYFAHSYAVAPTSSTCATTQHGQTFTAICHQRNFYGVQFHPERSGEVGAQILKNFLEL